MAPYAMTRVAQFLPTLALVSIIVFLMVRAIPGDAAHVLLGPTAKPEQIEAIRDEMGLEQPIWTQYGIWLGDVLTGDLGNSWINGQGVASLIKLKLPSTLALALGAVIVAMMIAIPVGVLAALRQGSWVERAASAYMALGLGIPSFWLGILLVLVFSLRLGWFPPSGYVPFTDDPVASVRALVLPSVTLGIYFSAVLSRFMKASILEALGQDYVRTAYAKGLGQRAVVSAHVLKNALIPVVTTVGLQFGGLLGGAVIVESIFGWPGLGRLLVTSIASRDYAVVQGTILLASVAYLVVNLLTDLTYGLLDPRIRTS